MIRLSYGYPHENHALADRCRPGLNASLNMGPDDMRRPMIDQVKRSNQIAADRGSFQDERAQQSQAGELDVAPDAGAVQKSVYAEVRRKAAPNPSQEVLAHLRVLQDQVPVDSESADIDVAGNLDSQQPSLSFDLARLSGCFIRRGSQQE